MVWVAASYAPSDRPSPPQPFWKLCAKAALHQFRLVVLRQCRRRSPTPAFLPPVAASVPVKRQRKVCAEVKAAGSLPAPPSEIFLTAVCGCTNALTGRQPGVPGMCQRSAGPVPWPGWSESPPTVAGAACNAAQAKTAAASLQPAILPPAASSTAACRAHQHNARAHTRDRLRRPAACPGQSLRAPNLQNKYTIRSHSALVRQQEVFEK